MIRRGATSWVLIVVLAACTATAPRSPAPAQDPALDVGAGDDLSDGHVIDVQPLAAPGVAALLERARAAERRGELAEAGKWLREALALAPRDPEAWQRLAELALLAGEWTDAIDHARASFDNGPKVGSLCYRNWMTISRARQGLGEEDRSHHALGEAEDCRVRARARL